ncbi:acetolactate synthase small subunit [Nicoletella semolina]|uniref:Acetolactate synthase small subunit n=1 Tax=Nicoletella semolina TaxID=271160 RepID=A0A4R2N6D3_9PAST|nr:acetolactate synthase 2 small subunit [Nicoletella semolina]MDH2925270.1 acetolactate synthase [Nicoletella semolina]TCP16355.1 acetolactate synthase small subunit [Nicoletella semolina]
MQSYQLVIKANKRPETTERLLRVIRHRGFELLSLQLESEQKTLTLKITVKSERAISLLKNQIAKLPDVLTLH